MFYIDNASPVDLKSDVLDRIKRVIITGEKKMSSIKEYFMKEGYEHGFKRGIEQVALNMLKIGESTEKIALYTGLSEKKDR